MNNYPQKSGDGATEGSIAQIRQKLAAHLSAEEMAQIEIKPTPEGLVAHAPYNLSLLINELVDLDVIRTDTPAEMSPDNFGELAEKLIAEIDRFEEGDVDNAVGDDSARIKREIVTEFLRRNFAPF